MIRPSFVAARRRRPVRPLVLALACTAIALPVAATAATITVTTTTDEVNVDGDCSLREAIRAANLNSAIDACTAGSDANTDTVTLASGATYSLTIPGTEEVNALTGSLDVVNNTAVSDLVINVAGGGSATIAQDASPDDLVLRVLGTASVELDDVTIRGGTAPAGSSGGGITAATGSTVVLKRCVLEDNVAGNNGGAINANGTLSLDGCIVRDNFAPNSAGGVTGGTSATMAINDTLFRGNVAEQQSGGAIRANAALVVTNSSFVDNFAAGLGGAIASGSAVIGAVSITNSCIIGNEDFAVDSFGSAAQVATGNWWGTSDGPSGDGPGSGDEVGPAFDFSGFESTPPAACRPQELVANGTFGAGTAIVPSHWRTRKLPPGGSVCTGTDCTLLLPGDGTRKQVLQTLDVAGSAGDSFTFSARSAADGVPAIGGKYLVELQIIHSDGSKQRKVLKFSSGTHAFEERVKTITATEPYARLKVRVEYGRASGTATFDDVSVLLE